jgi:hypothetical protein
LATEGIALADREGQRLGRDQAGSDPGRDRLGAEPHDRGVDVARGYGIEERLVLLLGERDLDGGVSPMEGAQCPGEAMVDGPRHSDLESSVHHAAQRGDLLAAQVGRGESRACVRQEGLTGDREPDRALISMKERLPELTLESTDLGTDGWLGNPYSGGGAGELALLRDRDKVRKLPQFHNGSL